MSTTLFILGVACALLFFVLMLPMVKRLAGMKLTLYVKPVD